MNITKLDFIALKKSSFKVGDIVLYVGDGIINVPKLKKGLKGIVRDVFTIIDAPNTPQSLCLEYKKLLIEWDENIDSNIFIGKKGHCLYLSEHDVIKV